MSDKKFSKSWNGIPVSMGHALGHVLIMHAASLTTESLDSKNATPEEEIKRFRKAVEEVLNQMILSEQRARSEVGQQEAQIFEAHQMMLQDVDFQDSIISKIQQDSYATEAAIQQSVQEQMDVFNSSESDYLKERALDVKDIGQQLLESLHSEMRMDWNSIQSPVILVADDLTPSQTIRLPKEKILGIATNHGGKTSHTAILARNLGIPAIVGLPSHFLNELQNNLANTEYYLDGSTGLFCSVDSELDRIRLMSEIELEKNKESKLDQFRGKVSQSKDGIAMKLLANMGSPGDLQRVLSSDAEGVGLFRSEFLFMERKTAPTEDEQCHAYAEVLNGLAPKEVVIRTLDVGGDKPIAYLPFPKEENPFLGLRALRYCLANVDVFRTQIRALLRANLQGNLSILLPMVSRATEAKHAVQLIKQWENELATEMGHSIPVYRIGAMVEIPSIGFELSELSHCVSFISVGTNDLLQYFCAVDRMNSTVAYLYQPYQLGFIRFMNQLADSAKKHNIEIGICGELGGDPAFLPLWLAMGYQKISQTSRNVLRSRQLLSHWSVQDARALLDKVLSCEDENQVEQILKN
jgi:phosphotransferase system enzyme I (PtsI)